jgi:FkbM family methyltransferase
MAPAQLPLHKRLVWYAQTLKALNRQDHAEILPLLEQYIPKDGIVIDVGAGKGRYTRLFAQAAPQGHVYAFEPGGYPRSILSRVITAKKLQNVSLFPVGLSDKESIEMPAQASGGGCPVMNVGSKTDAEKIIITTLDEFASLHDLKRVNFIRADIGGNEMRFLQGAHRTIGKHCPVLFLATGNDSKSAEEMWSFLKHHNYRIDRIENNGRSLTRLETPVTNAHIWCVAEERRRTG